MNQSLNARLKRIEAKVPPNRSRPPVAFLPDNGMGPDDAATVREKWDRYLATGLADSPVILVPDGINVVAPPDGPLVMIVEDDDFYGNRDRLRECIAQREADIASGKFIPTP